MNIKLPALAVVLATGFLPLAAHAQSAPPPPPPPQDGPRGMDGPSPEMRAQMDKLRADTRAAMFAALTPAHRTAVQSVIDDLGSGKSNDPRDAATKIDAILTPDETKAILAEAQKQRDKMIAMRPAGAGMPPGPPPGRPGPGPGGETRREADAGRMLLMLSISRERMRELRNAAGNADGQRPAK